MIISESYIYLLGRHRRQPAAHSRAPGATSPSEREWRMRISVAVDGVTYTDDVEPRTLLVQYLAIRARQDRHAGRM